jgi:RNA recognition motif-containing protein
VQFGIVTGIRVAMDDAKSFCRGFAFVDFDTEVRFALGADMIAELNQESAHAALALNSTELKKRNISVTIADARQAGTKARSKSVRPDVSFKTLTPAQTNGLYDQSRIGSRSQCAGHESAG